MSGDASVITYPSASIKDIWGSVKFRAVLSAEYIKVARKILFSGYIKARFAILRGNEIPWSSRTAGGHRARMRKLVWMLLRLLYMVSVPSRCHLNSRTVTSNLFHGPSWLHLSHSEQFYKFIWIIDNSYHPRGKKLSIDLLRGKVC